MKKMALVVLLLLFTSPVFAETIIHVKADSITRYKKINSYFAKGNCLIYDDTYKLTGDKAQFNKLTYIADIEGNVNLTDNSGNWIKGTRGIFNFSSYRGFIDNAVMFIKSDELYIKAKRIIISDKNKYYVDNAVITGCKCDKFLKGDKNAHPKWSIKAKHNYIVKGDYIFSYPVTFKARNVPVFFTPFLTKNINTKRKSGFLFPSLGYSSKNGFKYEQPFFWAISDSQDATITPFTYGRAGYGLFSEYRFYWTKNSKGKWNVTLFKEKKSYGKSTVKKKRLSIKATQNVDLKKYGTFSYDLNLVNDKDNLRVINNDNMELTSSRYTKSTASYYVSKNEYSLGINSYYYQDLIAENNKSTLQTLPEIKFSIVNKKLWKNLTLDLSDTASNNFRIKGKRGYDNNLTAALSYPFKISYFSIVPKIGEHYLYAYWKDTNLNKKYSERAFIPFYSIEAKTGIEGIFLNNNKSGFKGVRHTMTPSLKYQYIPYRKYKFPDFVSTYSKTNTVTATLENTVTGKYINDSKADYRELLYNKISQDYDFAKANHIPFPPIYEETRLSPFKDITFSSKAHFSTYKGMFKDSDEDLNLTFNNYGISAGYIMSRDTNYKRVDESLKSKVFIYPIKKLYLYAYIEKSIFNHYYPQRKLGFMYNEDCWGIGLDLYVNEIPEEQDNGDYERRKNTGFWLTFVLKGIGEIKRQY